MEDAEPIETLTSYARKTMSEGGDAKSIIETARDVAAARTHEEKQAKIDRMREKAEMSWMVADPKGYKEYREQKKGDISSDLKVGSQEILEDGTIIQSTSKGPVVYNPQGERVAGQAAADAVAVARAQKVSNARKAAGEKKRAVLESELDLKAKVEAGVIGAKDAAKISTKAFDRLEGINQNIANLDEGIRLLKEEGANTGVVDKYLPSFKKATIRLNNLQGQLGLDVLRNTTFGALSASELAFALDTAVPKGLQPLELAAWFEEKKASQEKLADYVESAAIYLGTPGNTVAGWIKKKRDEENKKPPKYKEGQTANGGKLIFKGGAWRDNT
ncbi:MAG: hypothetical protein GY755_10715 [Chloroflexi bacterium]|nr:hypothetical protein [Chloroflexota bacterium]